MLRIKPTNPDQRGFSLVEIMIVAGILSLIVAGSATFFLQMMKNQNRLDARMDYLTFKEYVRTVLSNTTTCSSSLGSQEFLKSAAETADGDLVSLQLPNYPLINETDATKFEEFKLIVQGVTLRNAQLVGTNSLGYDVYRTDMVGNFFTTRPTAEGTGELGEKILGSVLVAINAGQIETCVTANDLDLAAQELNCIAVGGVWDPVEKKCTPPTSPIQIATCPAGQVLSGFNADGSLICVSGPAGNQCTNGMRISNEMGCDGFDCINGVWVAWSGACGG